MGLFNDVSNIANMLKPFMKQKEPVNYQREKVTRKCPTCGNKMMQGRATIDERGNKNFGLIYCPEDVGMLADGADVVKHESAWYDPVYYCDTCHHGIAEFSLKLEFGNMPKALRQDRKVSGHQCPYCDKPMEQGNFFIAFMDRYNIDWYDEDVFQFSYTAPLRKRSFTLRRAKEYPNACVCKKCKKVFAKLPLQRDLRKNPPAQKVEKEEE